MDDDEIPRLLASIDRRLALLTGPQERDLRQTLVDSLLRTPARVALFDAIDGLLGSADLAKRAGVSERAAQAFIKELLEVGIVRPSTIGGGRGSIVERDDGAIVQWYLGHLRSAQKK